MNHSIAIQQEEGSISKNNQIFQSFFMPMVCNTRARAESRMTGYFAKRRTDSPIAVGIRLACRFK